MSPVRTTHDAGHNVTSAAAGDTQGKRLAEMLEELK